jgi:hypothetical protein
MSFLVAGTGNLNFPLLQAHVFSDCSEIFSRSRGTKRARKVCAQNAIIAVAAFEATN